MSHRFRAIIFSVIIANCVCLAVNTAQAQTADATYGACILSDGSAPEANVTQAGCADSNSWTANTPNTSEPLGLCIQPDGVSSRPNVAQSACNAIWTENISAPPATADTPASANTQPNPATNITEPEVRIPIPGLLFTSPKDLLAQATANGTNDAYYIPYIAEYIRSVYEYAIGIAGVLALLMIIVSGFQWATSGGNSDTIGAAKTRIGQAVTGLVIVLGSYTLLVTINPALVNFVPLKINLISPVDLNTFITPTEQYLSPETLNQPQNFGSVDPSTLTKIPLITNAQLGSQTMYLLPATLAHFQDAMSEMKQKYPTLIVHVNSTFRSADDQYKMYQLFYGCPPATTLPDDLSIDQVLSHCTKVGNRAAKSVSRVKGVFQLRGTNNGHYAGNALDLTVGQTAGGKLDTHCSSATQSSAGTTDQSGSDSCVSIEQQQLIGVMLRHGFCVGIKQGSSPREPWHFELVDGKPDNIVVSSNWCVKAGVPYADKDHLPYAGF